MKLSPVKIGLLLGSGALALASSLYDRSEDKKEVKETAAEETRKYLDQFFRSKTQKEKGGDSEEEGY